MESAAWAVAAVLSVTLGGIAVACGSSSQGSTFVPDSGTPVSDAGAEAAPSFAHLAVEPATVTLKIALGGSASQAYKAFADTAGQTHVDVTSQCQWLVGDASFGSFAGA